MDFFATVVGRLWLLIRDLYSPWLLPYTQQQVNADCAAWIQQLSTDRKLLLPWIAADGPLAASVVASLVACVAFLHETIPARQSALSHVLSFYFQGYCHAGMKPHICQVAATTNRSIDRRLAAKRLSFAS